MVSCGSVAAQCNTHQAVWLEYSTDPLMDRWELVYPQCFVNGHEYNMECKPYQYDAGTIYTANTHPAWTRVTLVLPPKVSRCFTAIFSTLQHLCMCHTASLLHSAYNSTLTYLTLLYFYIQHTTTLVQVSHCFASTFSTQLDINIPHTALLLHSAHYNTCASVTLLRFYIQHTTRH